jgi:ligand-binding sensor domain-containing protein/putative methionine-R-sulfoxide reductase with GAF domain
MTGRFLLLIISTIVVTNVYGQLIFQNLREEDGLSAKQVRCLYKDEQGYLWIGTSNGLNRFDGAVVRQYKAHSGHLDFFVNAISPIEGTNKLLLATNQGLEIFNTNTSKFENTAHLSLLRQTDILTIKPDGKGRLWIVTKLKIYIYFKNTLIPIESIIPNANEILDSEFSASSFAHDSLRGGFWAGGDNVFFIDYERNIIFHKNNNPKNISLLNKSHISAIALDNEFNFWFSCSKDLSLNYLNYKNNKSEKYLSLDGEKIYDGCNYIFIDKKNRVWISTWSFAAYVKEPGDGIKKIPFDQNQTYSIGYGFFREAIEDKEGNVWLATINGISKSHAKVPIKAIYQLPSFDFFLHTGFSHANTITIDDHIVMASKEDGIVAYDMRTRTYQRYVVTNKPPFLENRFGMSVKVGSTWWFAGYNGIYFLEKGNKLKRLDAYPHRGTEKSSHFIFADKQGNIWFQIFNDALYRYNPRNGLCNRFDGTNERYGKFTNNICRSYVVLKSGNIVFSLVGTGILVFDTKHEKFSHYPVSGFKNFDASALAEDHQGNIWASNFGNGVVKLNQKGKTIDVFNTSNGLSFDVINKIAIDDRGFIWAAGREGLLFFNPLTKDVTKVAIDLGQTLENYWTNITVYNKRVYAVMLDHVVVIDPFLFASITLDKPPHITSVKIFDHEIKDFPYGKTLHLTADEDYLSFQYASVHHRDVPSLQYSYQLQGLDKKWISVGRSTTASYNNLSPGSYTFKVRSTDENGKWMTAVSSIDIYVKPPWWQTWWFISIVTSLAVTFIILIYRAHLHRKQKMKFDNTIDYFANSVYGENSVSEICWDISRNCISQLNFQDCVVYLWDDSKTKFVQKAAFGIKNVKEHEITNPLELSLGEGIVGAAAQEKRILVIPNTSKDSRYIVDDERRLSEIAVPIIHEGKVIGVIDSEHSKKRFFNYEHVRALSTIAAISATKIAEAQAEEKTQQKEIMLLEISKMLAESQLMALRAQMNPHFVFNCLNSIQECIVTEKYREASKYLNKFSKLFRMVLNNSDKNLVTIEEEIEVLDLYLQLEQMRFEQSFTYSIILDDDLEEDIVLPSMLLQPYVENALWHGLMHKKGERTLSIKFQRIDDDIFKCIIEDNGIGREKSFELKNHHVKAKIHKSKGLQISKDRLDLLQRQGQHASVNIIDKYSPDHTGIGTTVEIELSTFLKTT